MNADHATLVNDVIKSIKWDDYKLATGSAAGFGDTLARFLSSDDATARAQLWASMENRVFSQDDVFSAAVPTVRVLLASLVQERPDVVRIATLDLLFHIVHAAALSGGRLGQQCLDAAAQGGWLLVRHALESGPQVLDACLEVLELCAPDCARVLMPAG